MASPPRVVLGPPTFEAAVVRRELDNLELTHAGADLPAAVAAVCRLLEKTGGEGSRLPRREVCFLSDLQRNTWAPELDAAAMSTFRRQSQALSEAASLVVIDFGQPEYAKTRPWSTFTRPTQWPWRGNRFASRRR